MCVAMSFSSIADARNAINRLQDVFEAELVTENLITDPSLPDAIEVSDASFTWDITPQDAAEIVKIPKQSGPGGRFGPRSKAPAAPPAPVKSDAEKAADQKAEEDSLFKMKDVNFSIKRGQLVAIVGSVGSGKTSLLQGLIGEMRRTSGSVKFGGSVAYCGQSAWIQNATIRENVCFGRQFEPERYWKAVSDACLDMDLDMLPNGDMTEVGEKVRRDSCPEAVRGEVIILC